ncbi:hypothetical protein F751_6158 [Auxenochlorella protothecoides]|uniref:Uncharacterized protein n=1 Tax=Auxenochlorella protothecoides TaxID=3075 RepID=A0A087SHJ9_AUXPR|nr:hypothetical protein F751_6158 [Auxenochlorella protothecoides]KFM25203.1 hypothetical protein F751_6158 [Auxenochlorella protothecoides]
MGPGRFVDSQGLFSAPEFASAVAWSEDNVLACAQGSSVSLLHPGALDGPRAYTSPIQPGEWSLDQGPHAPPGTLAQDLAAIRAQAYASQWPALARSPSVRSVAWSGRGLAPQGGCALCVVTCDHQVKVFFPPVHHTSEWSDCRDLTGDIVEASQRVAPDTEQEWRPLQGGLVDSQSAPGQRSAAHGGGPPAAGNSPGAGDQEVEVLRLRGGARPEAGTDPSPDAKPGVPAAKRPRKAPHPSRAAGSDEGAAGAKSPESRTAGAAQGPSRGGPLVPPSAASAALLAAAAAAAPGLPAKEARAALLDAAVRAFLAQRGELPAPERPRYPTPSSHLKGADLGLLNGLPAVNVSSGVLAARRSIIVAAVRRFLALRKELPASQRPSYASRREHLRAADVRLAGRVTAEFATAFPRLLQQLGYDAGLFASVWLNRLRRGWDRVDGTLEAGLGVLEGPVPGGGAKSPASEGAWAGEGPALAMRDAGWDWLAVGARGGRVWLWKARPSERGPSLDATAAACPGEAGASLRLVRGLALGASWVTALAFLPRGGEGAHGAAGPGSSQTLAAGMSCGRVRLLTLDGDGGLLAQRCVLPPDLSPVTCLAAAAGCVAAGKADGRLHVWAAPLREAVACGSQGAVQGPGDDAVEDLRASTVRDTVGCPAAAHGHRLATGVAWGHRGMDPGALPLLVSAGLGGELCAWRVERGVHELTLAPAPAPSPAGRAKDAGQLQVHQRVVQSVVRLYCLPDPDQRGLQQAARAWVAQGAGAGGVTPLPSALWDVLCALRQPTETDGEDPPARLLSWLEPGAGAAAMELDLLLRRARGTLTAALAGDGRGATPNCPVEDEATEAVLGRVAAWVLASAGESGVDEELLGLAAAVPQRNELDASAPLAGGMEGATTALKTLKDGSTVVVARCPLTLLPLETSRTWQCCVCERRYARWEASGCVLCAGALGPLRGSLCLNVPCL